MEFGLLLMTLFRVRCSGLRHPPSLVLPTLAALCVILRTGWFRPQVRPVAVVFPLHLTIGPSVAIRTGPWLSVVPTCLGPIPNFVTVVLVSRCEVPFRTLTDRSRPQVTIGSTMPNRKPLDRFVTATAALPLTIRV